MKKPYSEDIQSISMFLDGIVFYILNKTLFSIGVFITFVVFIVAAGCVGSTVLIDKLTEDKHVQRDVSK
ncbi:MAG: hypothetical protein WC279_05575 [Sulfurimonas sp.]|jgi:hypothetical protein|uniref:hypothetical protein n=1 Tax=Sulfurimonas sp. TaxID=2022749 RepID=UPI0035679E85